MPVQQRRANIVWNKGLEGSGILTAASGALGELPVTYSARTSKPNGKTSPEELLACALATGFAMALAKSLGREGTPPEHLIIEAVCTLTRIEGRLTITIMALDVIGQVPGIDQSHFEEMATDAGTNCPVARSLRGNVHIRVTAHLDQSIGEPRSNGNSHKVLDRS